MPLITDMNMREMVASIVPEVHQDQDAIEHTDGWHGNSALFFVTGLRILQGQREEQGIRSCPFECAG
jgi:hypothetical protein